MLDWEALENEANGIVQDHFGEPIQYTHTDGSVHSVRGVFQEVFDDVSPIQGLAVGTFTPAITIRTADLPVPLTQKGLVEVRNRSYRVAGAPLEIHGQTHAHLATVQS